jgi:hypothetical protein
MADNANDADDAASQGAEAKEAVDALGSAVGDLVADYTTRWFTSFQKALDGKVTASECVSDAGRLTARLVRDWANLSVLAYETVEKVARSRASDEPSAGDTEDGG